MSFWGLGILYNLKAKLLRFECAHGPRTPIEGISQRNLKFWANDANDALAVPKNLGLGLDFRSYSEGDFLTGLP